MARKVKQHVIPFGTEHFVVRIFPPQNERVPTIRESTRFLFGNIEKPWLRTDGVQIVSSTQCVSLTDNSGQWVGVLRLHEHIDFSPNEMSKMQKAELVAISRGRARNSR